MRKGLIPSGGKFRRVHEVPRGMAVLRTPEEWHQRVVSVRWEGIEVAWPILIVLVFTAYLGLGAVLGVPATLSLMNASIYTVTYFGMFALLEVYFGSREVERKYHSGLFEHGLQLRSVGSPMHYFVPYVDILDFHVKDGWFYQTLVLDIRGLKRPFKMMGMPEILGEEGLTELRRRVDDPLARTGIPRLFVYGDRVPVQVPVNPLAIKETKVPVLSTRIQF